MPQPTGKKSTMQIPSLSALKSKITTKPKEESPAKEKVKVSPKQEETFGKDDLDRQWQAFISTKKEAGSDQEVMMLKEPYVLEDKTVTLKLSNEVLKITFDKMKSDLQGFLRTNLKNGKIILKAEVEELGEENMIYTNKEKFEHLAKKHPELKELQQKLGLDPDY